MHTPRPTRRSTSNLSLLPLLLLAVGWLGGCGGDGPAVDASDAEPRHGGRLTIAIMEDAKSLDPHTVADAASMRVIENLYSTLLRYSETYGEFEPDLAEAVDISDDGLTVTITLRRDARFGSGRRVTSADVAYSIERVRRIGVRAQQFEAVTEIQTPDDHIVALTLREPVAPLKSYLAYPMTAIVDREVVEASEGRLDRADAGSGPFRLVEWRRDQRLVMQRFEGYHLPERPYLDRVTFRPMPDETARTNAIRTGEIDIVNDVAAKDVKLVERARGVVVESVPGTFWEYIGINTRRPPLDDRRVRQAIAWAVDREAINRLVKFGRATPITGGHIPAGHWAHADFEAYPAPDADRARALLAEAGHADGLQLSMVVGAGSPDQVRAAEIIRQQLGAVGIDVQLRSQEPAVFYDGLGRGEFELTLVGWVGFVDPDEWTFDLFHTDGRYNQQGYSNSELDRVLEEARRTLDRGRRAELYAQAQRIITEDAPMVFLVLNDHTSARRSHVGGFRPHPTATTIGLRDTWVAQ